MQETTLFTEDELMEALDSCGVYDVDIRRGFSGRGMYEASCFGIVHNAPDALLGIAILTAYRDAMVRDTGDADMFFEALEATTELLRHTSTDSMGLSTITYFPGYILPGSGEDED